MDKFISACSILDDLKTKKEPMIKQRKEYIEKFVEDNLKFYPDASKEVLRFIADFLYHGVLKIELKDSAESIRSTFRAGYCYYFALMLNKAFGRGCLCWTAPFSHIVWMDTDGTPYDIEGVHSGENEYYIPIEYLGESIQSFMHVPGAKVYVRDTDEIINEYKEDLYSGKLEEKGLGYTAMTNETLVKGNKSVLTELQLQIMGYAKEHQFKVSLEDFVNNNPIEREEALEALKGLLAGRLIVLSDDIWTSKIFATIHGYKIMEWET